MKQKPSLGQGQVPRKKILNLLSQENVNRVARYRKAVLQSRVAQRRGERKFKKASSSYGSREKKHGKLNFAG